MELLLIFLPIFIESILPMILNKPAAVRNPALLRRVVRFGKLAESMDSTPAEKFAYGELADLCACCADADDEQLAGIMAGLPGASADIKAAASMLGVN